MELNEIKAAWDNMSSALEEQKRLTDKIILDMTKERFRGRIGVIYKYEALGSVVCFIMALVILVNFPKLDTWYLLACGIFTVGFLLIIPVLVLRSIRAMRNIDLANQPYRDIMKAYTKSRNSFLFLQRISIGLGIVLLMASFPVSSKIFSGKDILLEGDMILWFIPAMAVALILFARWGYSCYRNISESAGATLKELERPE